MQILQNILISQWHTQKFWGWLLWPFTQIFMLIIFLRQYLYKKNILASYKAPVPVVVIGNISVGGTGKTPLVIYIAKLLQEMGLRPGIVLRGYKGIAVGTVFVQKNSDPKFVGDEAVLLAQRCNCPVAIDKLRVNAVKMLIAKHNVNIILCDDGLQHYALKRDIEIAVSDVEHGFGNRHCLPMGPLREPIKRLQSVDINIVSGQDMHLEFNNVYSLLHLQKNKVIDNFAGQKVHAIAGIGMPDKFFQSLRNKGINVIPHAYPDHHAFKMQDINFPDKLPVLMTEKDAVKCRYFANEQHWSVTVSVVLADGIRNQFCKLVQEAMRDR